MTLIITDVSPWGIVMGADSAVTIKRAGETTVLTDAQKLRPVDYLKAGISFWGLAQIGGRYSWLWLNDLVDLCHHIGTLRDFADNLCNQLKIDIGKSNELMGFHLAGYVEFEGEWYPQVFHVHNAHHNYPQNQSAIEFHVKESLSPHQWQKLMDKYRNTPQVPLFELRNGDWYFYVQWLTVMEELIEKNFRAKGIQIPAADLAGRAEFLRFRIETIADLYKMSDSLKFVSEPIATLEMSPVPVYSRYSIR